MRAFEQSECQILWALYARRYTAQIGLRPFREPPFDDILWHDPAKPRPSAVQAFAQRVRNKLGRMAARLTG